MKTKPILLAVAVVLMGLASGHAFAQEPVSDPWPTKPIQHPALFLVGDSIVRTGTGNGETGPWGWGSEIGAFFDESRISVYNFGLGGRSSRGYREEGAWKKVLDQVAPGDWVLIQFGHNDAANSANYPDRTTLKGDGNETGEIVSPVTHQPETIHSYGWYLRQDVADAQAKGASVILLSPPPRNIWLEGKVLRGLDGYAAWAADAARVSKTRFIDLNTLSANKYDLLGEESSRPLFNDAQHSHKAGARLNADSVAMGLRGLKDCALASYLKPAAASVKQ